ncbi:MAG TPA: protein-disulfide reductase DsbD domain-containing protein [Dongiaceae bacterium]
MRHNFVTIFLLAALLCLANGVARAEPASAWVTTDQTKLRLISAVTAIGNGSGGGTVPLGLQITLVPGWKTYWRSPGDAGFPVSLDWKGSTNLASADLAWPVPHRFTLFGLDTFGYEDEVVFPIAAKPTNPAEPMGLRLKVNYLVCEKVCIPYSANLSLDLSTGAAGPSEFAQLIDRYASRVPGDGSAHGLHLISAEAAGDEAHPRLNVAIESALPLDHPDLIVEGPSGLYFPAPRVSLDAGKTHVSFEIDVKRDAKAPPLAGTPILLTVADGERGMEARVLPAAGGAGALWPALLAALLGGLILNLMPCVLPVLSLKLLAFVGHGGATKNRVRLSFLASTAGVLASFLILAGAIAGLRAAGVAVGWGLQFQQPHFLVGMALLLTLLAGNLWGWFELPLPGFAGRLSQAADRQHGLIGDFLTGGLATLLATPCTAPFLTTAVGFALAGSTRDIFVIFIALGIGLASPYLLVAAWPGLASRLPRPGAWMLILKRVLGIAMGGTAIWLLYVLAAQAGKFASLVSAAALIVVIVLLAWRHLRPRLRRGGLVAASILALLAPALFAGVAPSAGNAGTDAAWQVFSESALTQLISRGKVVLVDVTADWCINCQVNKALVLDHGWVADQLAAGKIVGLKADWTRPDPEISRYLASFGRYGIPFNAVYGPKAQQGLPLPTVLSESAVREAIGEAGGEAGGG